MSNINLGILFGGRSVEHDVSILTGMQAYSAVNTSKYNAIPVYLGRDNLWFIGDDIRSIEFFRQQSIPTSKLTRVYPCPDPALGKLKLIECEPRGLLKKPKSVTLDCILLATHGSFVEDGSLQGLLDMADVPYVGSGVSASAVGMDKLIFKSVMITKGLPIVPYVEVTHEDWSNSKVEVVKAISTRFAYPVIVKPASLGSSIGVNTVHNEEDLINHINLALRFGKKALAEPLIQNVIEINCAVLDGEPPIPSILEQPLTGNTLLTFEEKYVSGGGKKSSSKGMASQKKRIPADLDKETTEKIQQLAIATFKAIDASGVARIDFLIDQQGTVFVNEINTIPGSLSYYLWEHQGKSFGDLIERLVERSIEVKKQQRRLLFTFDNNLLKR